MSDNIILSLNSYICMSANTGLPILWSEATWHLLRRKPGTFPDTHRYRTISHEEFRVLSRYLDVYRSLGKIIVNDTLSVIILHRLTGLEVDQSGWKEPGKYVYDRISNPLGKNDHVLVAYGTTGGMYAHFSYAQADRAKFKSMVVTGVIEPKTVSCPPASKLIVIADRVARNTQRIAEAKRLLEETKDAERKSNLNNISLELVQENDSMIAAERITPRAVDEALANIEKELRFLAKEHDKSRLLLEIDSALNVTNEHDSTGVNEERQVQQKRMQAIALNISQHRAIVADLKALQSYMLLK